MGCEKGEKRWGEAEEEVAKRGENKSSSERKSGKEEKGEENLEEW